MDLTGTNIDFMETALALTLFNNMPWVWLGVAVLMTVIEGLTLGLTTIWLAIAALVTMVFAFMIPSITVQIIVFLLLSILLFIFTRPIAVKKMKLGKEKTNSDRFVGMTAVVTKPVTTDNPGQVKVGGQIWTARPEVPDETFEKGITCRIAGIQGVTLLITHETEESQVRI